MDLSVGAHQILYRALLERLDARHLHSQTQGGFLREQGGVDDLDLLTDVYTTRHKRKRVLAVHQSYLDIDAVDQETILQEQFHVESYHHFDDATLRDVPTSSQEPLIICSPVDIDGFHVIGRVLVPQLSRQLRLLGLNTVIQQLLDVGAIRVRVGQRGHERTVQVDVDLTEQ